MKEGLIAALILFQGTVILTQEPQLLLKKPLAFSSEQIYKGLRNESSSNFVFSPLSIHTVLFILSKGVSVGSESFNELAKVLSDTGLLLGTNGLDSGLKKLSETYEESSVIFKNQIWLAKEKKLKSEFVQDTTDFDINVAEIDFASPQAIKTINQWAKNITRNLITKIVDKVDPQTQCIIANALYLKEAWTTAFTPINSETTFYVTPGNPKNVKMMDRQDSDFRYGILDYKNTQHEVLKIPYNNSGLEMLLVLPDKETGLSGLENILAEQDAKDKNHKTLLDHLDDVEYSELDVYVRMPRFKITSDFKAKKILKRLGINRIFTDMSELNRLTQSDNLKVNNLVHKAVISVDLAGTEAAGVSAIDIVPLSIPKIFIVNRPFMFVIMDTVNEVPLIMGRIVDPSQ